MKKASLLLVFLYSIVCMAMPSSTIDIQNYYSVVSDSSLARIDALLDALEKEEASSLVNAYKGTLLMRKAQFINVAAKKLETFRKGKLLLEKEIKNHPQNIEYRFLRLLIQEHAPKFLHYDNNITSDKQMIIDGFKTMNAIMQKLIIDYSLKSKFLHKEEFTH